MAKSSFAPVYILTVAAFIFNTSEFVPIGLISDLSLTFAQTEAQTGIILTVYAWAVLIMSLPLVLIFSRFDYKFLLAGVLLLIALSHAASAAAPIFEILMGARIGVALSHALFWSIAVPMAVKIAPPGQEAKAVGLVSAGTAAAMVGGMPIGRVIGLYLGWRMTFLSLGICALILLATVIKFCPRVPGTPSPVLKVLPRIFTNGPLMGLYLITALIFTAHYIPYSYIEPYLQQVGAMDPDLITACLMLFGVSAIGIAYAFGRGFDAHPRRFVYFALGGLVIFLTILQAAAQHTTAAVADILCWGLAFSAFSLSFQALVLKLESTYAAVATAIYSAICNLGIGAGAFVGAHLIDAGMISYLGYSGALLALICLVLMWLVLVRYWLPKKPKSAKKQAHAQAATDSQDVAKAKTELAPAATKKSVNKNINKATPAEEIKSATAQSQQVATASKATSTASKTVTIVPKPAVTDFTVSSKGPKA